ncbi:MAG: hypothetical protein EB060_07085 [Proteobacteria bacterium]|nr:hypothetical protein [Pseudomonadota bacterium]
MKKSFALILMLAAVSGCGFTTAGPPWQQWMYEGPPAKEGVEYPPLYVQGWKDGCHTGTAAQVPPYYKQFYSFKQDYELAQNKVYYQGWKDAFDYCQKYLNQYYYRDFI